MSNVLKKYIRNKSADLWNLFIELDIEDCVMTSKKLKRGFTFLFPDPEYISVIAKLSDTDEDAAIDIIRSLFITEFMQTPGEWNSHKNDIQNLHNYKVEIKSISGRTIELMGGALIEHTRGFNRETDPVAVYNIIKGRIHKGTIKCNRKTVKKIIKTTTSRDARRILYNSVINCQNPKNLCLGYIASFMQYLIRHKQKSLVENIAPYLDYCPITSFMILFEPGKGDLYFIDSSIINDWFSEDTSPPKNNRSIFQKVLMLVNDSKCTAYNNSSVVAKAIQELRDDAIDNRIPSSLIHSLNESYNQLIYENSILNVRDVLPVGAFEYMQSRCTKQYNLKLMQDELRGIISSGLENGDDCVETIKEAYAQLRFLPRFNDMQVANAQTKSAFVSMVSCFINTTYFLYLTPSIAGEFGGDPQLYINADPITNMPYDPVPAKMESLKNMPNASINTDELAENIQAMIESGETMPENLLAAARSLFPDATH